MRYCKRKGEAKSRREGKGNQLHGMEIGKS